MNNKENRNNLSDFGSFIDNLRKARNMSREDFIEGTISLRQYQRYVNGETSLNNDKLFKLIDKLELDFLGTFRLYLNKKETETHNLYDVYGAITFNDLVKAEDLLQKIDKDSLQNAYNKLFYDLCTLLILRRTKKMPNDLIMTKLIALINYPNCLNNEVITFIELVAYIELGKYSSKNNKKNITNFLYSKIKEKNIISNALPISFLPSIYSTVSSALGELDEYEKSLYIAEKGITYCFKHDNLNSLVNLFAYKSLSLFYLDRKDEALAAAEKMLALLFVEDKPNKSKQFVALFEKIFNTKAPNIFK